jgi:transcription antitermination factor NusG
VGALDGRVFSQCLPAPMPYWAVARTLVNREPVAVRGLRTAGFEIFAPSTERGRLLFPGYLFVRIVDQWQAIDRTIGVIKLVRFGETPARCPDAEIDKLLAQVNADGFVRLPARPPEAKGKISIGANVRIAGLAGIYVGMGVRERQRVLIHLLGRPIVAEVRSGVRPELS